MCFPHHRIVYKQITLPALMTLHTGYWTFAEDDDGVAATSQHTVVINTGEHHRGPRARGRASPTPGSSCANALSANSRATLGHAKDYAESRR